MKSHRHSSIIYDRRRAAVGSGEEGGGAEGGGVDSKALLVDDLEKQLRSVI